MADRVYRPTMKFVGFWYLVAFAACIAGVFLYRRYGADQPRWIMALPLLLFLIPLRMHVRRQSVKLILRGDRLSWQSGLFSKSTRTMDVSKVQDVRVQQSAVDRMFGIGSLTIQTAGAGDGGSITMDNLNSPHAVAEAILDLSKREEMERRGPRPADLDIQRGGPPPSQPLA